MLVAYIPVLHQGYVNLLRNHGGEVGILGPDVISEFTSLVRDIRALDSYRMKSAIEALGLVKHVRVLTLHDLIELQQRPIVMVDDDISRDLAERHHLRATFEPIFLRWDRMATTESKIPEGTRRMSLDALHHDIMRAAFAESAKSADWWRQIGAVIVKDGKIIAKGHNHHLPSDFHLAQNGDPRSNFNAGERIELSTAMHGEAGLIAECAKNGVALLGASIYVTTFPCPNCARLIAKSGINRVYYTEGYSLLDAQDIFKAFDVECIFVDLPKTNL